MANPTLYGYRVCPCIVSSAPLVEKRFREAGLITHDFSGLISQGCYSAGAVAASAGTHDGGGVLDLRDFTPYRADADVLFTACGWIDFYRPYGILYARSPAHHHVVLDGCPHLATAAQRQVTDAKAGMNGLAGKGKDSGPRPGVTWQQAVAADSGPGGVVSGTVHIPGAPSFPNSPVPQEDHMSAAQVETLTALTQQVLDAVQGEGVNLADIPPLYVQLLGRDSTPDEAQYWFITALGTGMSTRQLRNQIAAQVEALTWAITSGYIVFCGRVALPQEVADWLKSGLTFDAILTAIATSDEAKAHAATKK